jgi:hypothetical protein
MRATPEWPCRKVAGEGALLSTPERVDKSASPTPEITNSPLRC